MKKYAFLIYFFILLMFIIGCGFRPLNPQELINDNPGKYPDNYEQIVKDYLHEFLSDPYSIRDLNITQPYKSWYNVLGRATACYKGRVSFNAKNRMGGYVGKKVYLYIIRYGRVREFQEVRY